MAGARLAHPMCCTETLGLRARGLTPAPRVPVVTRLTNQAATAPRRPQTFLSGGRSSFGIQFVRREITDMAKVEEFQLIVRDEAIHCDGCESRIETVLKQLPGVLRAKADHVTQIVTLALDSERTPLDEVKRKLAFAGFVTE